jgi:hypothetical protein
MKYKLVTSLISTLFLVFLVCSCTPKTQFITATKSTQLFSTKSKATYILPTIQPTVIPLPPNAAPTLPSVTQNAIIISQSQVATDFNNWLLKDPVINLLYGDVITKSLAVYAYDNSLLINVELTTPVDTYLKPAIYIVLQACRDSVQAEPPFEKVGGIILSAPGDDQQKFTFVIQMSKIIEWTQGDLSEDEFVHTWKYQTAPVK